MSWLFEANPIIVIACGGVALAILLTAIANTGRRLYLYLIPVALLLTGGILLVEWSVITPREEVEKTLQEITADLNSNDHEAVLVHISTTRPDLEAFARDQLERGKISDARVWNDLEITVHPERQPPQATATFHASARVRDRDGVFPEFSVKRAFVVVFRREEDGAWRVREYEMPEESSR